MAQFVLSPASKAGLLSARAAVGVPPPLSAKEGQLGALRDPDHGIYPYSTSSSPLAGFGAVGAGLPPYAIQQIVAVVKAYSTCVGAGPFVTEIADNAGDTLRRLGGDAGEYGATTGRPRRVGWFDAVATRYGCRIQGATEIAAGVDDRETATAIGLNVERAFFVVFCLGCALAGLAGVVAGPVLSIYPGMDISILILALIVVVVGGPGSLKGAALGALLVGMVETFGQVLAPEYASVLLYALMALVLVLLPGGLIPVGKAHG